MQHLIRKQTILLEVPKQLDAFNMQHMAGKHYRNDVLPLLEQVFNELADSDELVQIAKLEIDLGQIAEKDMLVSNWNDTILAGIRKQLYAKLGREAKEKIYTREHATLGSVRQWLLYMKQGCLPWNAVYTGETWYRQVLEALAVDFESVAALKNLIRQSENARRRIVLQHDENFLTILMEILTAESQRTLTSAVAEIGQLYQLVWPHEEARSNSNTAWQQLLLAAATENSPTTAKLVEAALQSGVPGIAAMRPVIAQLPAEMKLVLPIVKKLADNHGDAVKKKTDTAGTEEATVKQNADTTADSDVIDEEGIFVQYAGIVLIHPFVSTLFKKMQLVKDGKFDNYQQQQKGLYLLHYLATGKTTAEEYELAVPKLLCNWAMEYPVEKNCQFTKAELEEADNMLQAAIDQWTVLKSTSVDGLREGFLQRPGKLSRKKDKLYLQVEAGAIDVLLDQLPWNLGMVKLPWMKELLWVEWR